MTWWTLVAAVWVAVFAGGVVGWRLRGSVQQRGHGGMLDLTPPAGELDLDWNDSRLRGEVLEQSRILRAQSRDHLAVIEQAYQS